MNTRSPSLRANLTRAAAVTAATMAGAILAGQAAATGPAILDATRDTPTPHTSRVATLLDRHDCWTGAAPAGQAGKIPGAVVVTFPGRMPIYSQRPAVVGAALESLFGSHPRPGVRVHGFCPAVKSSRSAVVDPAG